LVPVDHEAQVKIWRVGLDPTEYSFAQATEWPVPYAREEGCASCSKVLRRPASPLEIFWEPGSDRIGDAVFVPSARCLVVAERLWRRLEQFGGVEALPVEFVENPDRRLPKRKPRVRLPYEGPPLYEVRPSRLVHFDRAATRTKHKQNSCGHEYWIISPGASIETKYDPISNQLNSRVIPREPGNGIFVKESDLEGDGLFGLIESGGLALLCTDRVRDALVGEGFSQLQFMDEGETLPD
jgi:hypothetical protein